MNMYAYVQNSPNNYWDKLGLFNPYSGPDAVPNPHAAHDGYNDYFGNRPGHNLPSEERADLQASYSYGMAYAAWEDGMGGEANRDAGRDHARNRGALPCCIDGTWVRRIYLHERDYSSRVECIGAKTPDVRALAGLNAFLGFAGIPGQVAALTIDAAVIAAATAECDSLVCPEGSNTE